MYLRTLIGPRAGEIFDFSPEASAAMLADGRAELPDAAPARPEAGEPAASAPPTANLQAVAAEPVSEPTLRAMSRSEARRRDKGRRR